MLAVWVDDRAWTTGEGVVEVFNGTVGWLRERQVLLLCSASHSGLLRSA